MTDPDLVDCPNCIGSGYVECPECDGFGCVSTYHWAMAHGHEYREERQSPCPSCESTGVVRCTECRGAGIVEG